MDWQPPERNRSGIDQEVLRNKVVRDSKTIDQLAEEAHDALSAHYYRERDLPNGEKTPFVWKGTDHGALDRDKFEALHGLVFDHRQVMLNAENQRLDEKDRIPAEKVNPVDGGKTKTETAQERIAELKEQGIELSL